MTTTGSASAGVGDDDGLGLGVGVGDDGVGLGVGVGDDGVGLGVGVGDDDGLGLGVGVGDDDGLGLGVGVGLGLGVGRRADAGSSSGSGSSPGSAGNEGRGSGRHRGLRRGRSLGQSSLPALVHLEQEVAGGPVDAGQPEAHAEGLPRALRVACLAPDHGPLASKDHRPVGHEDLEADRGAPRQGLDPRQEETAAGDVLGEALGKGLPIREGEADSLLGCLGHDPSVSGTNLQRPRAGGNIGNVHRPGPSVPGCGRLSSRPMFERAIERLTEHRWAAPALVLLVACGTMLPWLGSFPLLQEWEPHYGQVVREMLHRGEWLDPTYRDEPFFDKPILPFFLECISVSLLGQTELAIRLPMALMGIAGVLAVFFLLGRIYNRRTALIASLILATTPFYYLVARQFMFDMPFVALETAAMLCLVLGGLPRPDDEPQAKRRRYLAAMWILLGLALITKGLLAIAVPGAVGLIYVLITWDWRVVKRLELWWGLPLMLAVGAPWYLFMYHRHGVRFLQEFFVEHHLERMEGELDKPTGTFEFYVRELGIGMMPWVALLPLGLAHAYGDWKLRLERHDFRETFLRLSFLAPFVFFTLSSTKFPHYILPAVPFLVILIARALDAELADPERRTSRLLWVLAAVALGLIAKDLLEGRNYRLVFYLITTHRLQDFHPLVANPHTAFAIVFGLAGAVVALALLRRRLAWVGFVALLVVNLGYATYLNGRMVPELCRMFSARSLVDRFMELRSPGDSLADYRTWKTRALTYYLPIDEPLRRISSLGSFRSWQNEHPGRRLFVTVEERNLGQLRQIASQAGEQLYVVGDDAVEDYREILLVSTRPNEGTGDPREEAVIGERPRPATPSSAVFGSSIRLLGTDVQPAEARPDETVHVTYYFECLGEMRDDYEIFTHIEPVRGEGRFVNDHHPSRSRFPTSLWRRGDLVRDEFTVTVPTGAAPGPFRVMMGLFHDEDRMPVTPASANAGDNRVEAATFQVR